MPCSFSAPFTGTLVKTCLCQVVSPLSLGVSRVWPAELRPRGMHPGPQPPHGPQKALRSWLHTQIFHPSLPRQPEKVKITRWAQSRETEGRRENQTPKKNPWRSYLRAAKVLSKESQVLTRTETFHHHPALTRSSPAQLRVTDTGETSISRDVHSHPLGCGAE